jgi:chemotaxis protein MotB
MARRRRHQEPENHERWLVSYADFITLLFAFFVVMYSMSSVNEGKYKILSDTLTGVFNQPDRSIQPFPIGDRPTRSGEPVDPDAPQHNQRSTDAASPDPLQGIAQSLREAFGGMILSDQMTLRGNELWIEIELKSSLLFPSGDAIPTDAAFSIIEKVAKILTPYANPIHIEGFTDNQPINTAQYPTNWELSTARAASMVRLLAMQGVNPERLAAVGYGEFQPVADNATAAGRGRNRRVVLVISRNLDVRRSVSGVGSANATVDGTLQRAGTQSAAAAAARAANPAAVNSPSPAL